MNSAEVEIASNNNEEIATLLKERKIPDRGLDVMLIEDLLLTLSMMDSNNYTQKSSVGEREGRCFSSIVARRHYYFAHGIGRSGDLIEPQPKAAGSSILYKITNLLLTDFMKLSGLYNVNSLLVPLSKQFTLRLSLILFLTKRKGQTQVWYDDENIKQLILDAGMIPCYLSSYQFFSRTLINDLDAGSINCFILKFNTFKDIMGVIMFCRHNYIPVILHNVQCTEELMNLGTLLSDDDLIIYKDNLSIIPTGTTIISSSGPKIIEEFARIYPGRASISSAIDIFVTLLSLGRDGLLKLTKEKKQSDHNLSVSLQKNVKLSNNLSHVGLMEDLVPKTFFQKGLDALLTRYKHIETLFSGGKIPNIGWNEMMIEHFLGQMSLFEPKQTCKDHIRKRHYNFVNGVDCIESKMHQTSSKTASVILRDLTRYLLIDLFEIMGINVRFGIQRKVRCILLPVATGMSLVLSMLALRRLKPGAKYVIWSRIDQKSCFKSIVTAGLIPIIIDTKKLNNEYTTDIEKIKEKVTEVGTENILCIMSTTSCFAPRACDNIETISEICKEQNLFHLVNNAYGLTSRYLMKRIRRAKLKGKLDIFVQSTDKNCNVPVGGAIVAIFGDDEYNQVFESLENVCSGNMSMSTILDTFITLVSMGTSTYIKMVDDRESMYSYLKTKLMEIAEKHGEEVLENPENPISIALTLRNVPRENVTRLGSMLFLRNVFGSRIVSADDTKNICGYHFSRWGAHSEECNVPYIASAAAFGVCQEDIHLFINKLDNQLTSLRNTS